MLAKTMLQVGKLTSYSCQPVDQGAEVVSSSSSGVRGNPGGDALIDAHLDAGPCEDEALVSPHLGLTLW